MSDDKLKRLKDLAVPRPSARAKPAALAAAAAAFAGGDEEERSAKGNVVSLRQTHMTSHPARRNNMRFSRTTYVIAASVAAVALSLPVAMYFLREQPQQIAGPGPSNMFGTKSDPNAAPPAKKVATSLSQANGSAKGNGYRPNAAAAPVGGALHDSKRVARSAESERHARAIIAKGRLEADRLHRRSSELPVIVARKEEVRPAAELKKTQKRKSMDQALGPMAGYGIAPNMRSVNRGQARERFAYLRRRDPPMPRPPAYDGRDKFENVAENPVKSVASEPVSTFSVDVDTASYSFVRRALNAGRLPQKNAVRVEEMINYFAYDYARPDSAAAPFKPSVSVLPSPWSPHNKLVHIAIKGYALKAAERPKANLVFLMDVSGSMQGHDRLPLVKNAFAMLLDNLKPDDTVGLVTYASRPGVALQPTKVADKGKIIAAINGLGAGGSTAGAGGIQSAYALAEANFDKAAVNRIILATDGDFNVGISNREELKSYIERKRKSGIFLSVLGVGQGNYNDALMQALAQNGNGIAAYIDTLGEARKVLVEEASSTLFPIAKDVKVQIEFNPARISHYRLIGYESRALKREDFNNDKVDAGDVGSGHAVTAIYEVTPVGADIKLVDDLRYGRPAAEKAAVKPDPNAEFGFLKLRYKLPSEDKSRLITLPITSALESRELQSADIDVRFSTAVAAFGQLLRGGVHMGGFGYDDVIALALGAKGSDPFGARAEFVNLVRLAKSARPNVLRATRSRRARPARRRAR